MSEETVIEVFADVVCPFTHVGLRRFAEMRDQLGRGDVRLRIRSWPLELVNNKMPKAAFIAEEIDDIRTQVTPDLFVGFDESAFPKSSLPALALAWRAYGVDLATGEAVSLELRDLLFEQGRDISDPVILAELADRFGLRSVDRTNDVNDENDAVLREYEDGIARAVIGSPHFFTRAGNFFCPALEIRRDTQGCLHVEFDIEGFQNFLTSCFR